MRARISIRSYLRLLRMSSTRLQPIRMPTQVNVQPNSQPCVSADTMEDYYCRNMAIPFLDHVILEFESKFSPLSVTASRLLGLISYIQCNSCVTADISKVVQFYQDYLPSPEQIDHKLKRWTLKWQNKPSEQRPTLCDEAIKQ